MTDPATTSPPAAKSKSNCLLVGCLAVVVVFVLGVIGLVALGALSKHLETPQQRAADKAQEDKEIADDKAAQAAKLAPTFDAAKLAQARLAAVAAAVTPSSDLKLKAVQRPRADGASLEFAPVDAEYMRRFHGLIPRDTSGTLWLRHKAFADLADEATSVYANAENDAYAVNDADKKLTDIGYIGVIHTTNLKMPRLLSAGGVFKDGSFDAGVFEGWIQIVSYPGAKTLCEVPFTARSSDHVGGGMELRLRIRGIPVTGGGTDASPQQQVEDDFEANVFKAAQAAVDGAASTQ